MDTGDSGFEGVFSSKERLMEARHASGRRTSSNIVPVLLDATEQQETVYILFTPRLGQVSCASNSLALVKATIECSPPARKPSDKTVFVTRVDSGELAGQEQELSIAEFLETAGDH